MRWGRSRRYSSANLPALRAGDGGIFPSADGGAVLSGSAMPDFHPSPGAANGGRSVTAQPTMAACSATGSIACVRRWKPLAWRDGHRRRRGYGAFFNATRSPRSALYAARRLLRHGWQRLRAGRGSIWSMAMRWSPVCCDPPSTPACVFSSMPRWSGCCRVRRACPARCCAATAGDSRRSWRRGAGLRRFSHDRQRLAQVVPHAAEGYGHFSAAPPDNQGEGSGLANPSAASSTLPCATRWHGRRCPASLWPAASS